MRSINANEDVKNPKQSILSAARVPKEMITRAERRINAEASEIERLINRKRKDKTGFERWIEFVNDNFDNFALNLRHDLKEKGKEKLASVDIADQTDVISSSKAVTSSEEPPLKCFSCSLTPLLRPDLPPGIKQGFIDCIRNTLISSTDYIYEFSLQMLKSVLVFKKSTFDMDENNNVTLKPKNGPLVSDILPEIRQEKYSALYLPPPLDHKLC
ncbi:hypothetical protein MFLAVUS_002975 [Mucor flavus]|uniref:Uncharacterized protein n=1 Tax=Mucor flavus TaxID=439312 RepID=A0ABP9YRS6_9FUNG